MSSHVELKYVIVDHAMPICFVSQHHKEMKAHGNITSAAFFKVTNGKIETYGKSVSLNMGPDPNDAIILSHFFGLE